MSFADDLTVTDASPISRYLAVPVPDSATARENALGAFTTLLDGWRYGADDESALSQWHEQHEAEFVESLDGNSAALQAEIDALEAEIAALQAVDRQLEVSNELALSAFTFRAFKNNLYNATQKVTSGAVTRAISNYRTAAATNATLDATGLKFTANGNLTLLNQSIGTQNIDFHSWVRLDTGETARDIFSIQNPVTGVYVRIRKFWLNSTPYIETSHNVTNSTNNYATASVAQNAWFYLQYRRIGSAITLHLNGTQVISRTVTLQDYGVSSIFLGYYGVSTNNPNYFNSPELIIGGAAAQITVLPDRE